ncbi:MAG: hypothetical protein EA376_08195 [Phycisphaeraceae bacterium]|nr:MAG: hypothetical protein EA376_08195 [Phycisphaeraceae bacterium]
MFFIRQAKPNDAGTLLKLARMVHFINLPANKEVISEKVRWSDVSFATARGASPEDDGTTDLDAGPGAGAAGRSPQFMFVMEETETGNTIGVSSIIASMGAPGNPNIGMQLRKREFFSKDLQIGATHITAQLVQDEDGPTEIGSLILGPSYRGHPAKLGKQLSLIRFHYMALHRDQFKDRILAEMMGPITPDVGNTLWEYFGRRFINLSYAEADRFCAYSREFMTALLPREEIYLTLLPAEARALIGQVGPETLPARIMLEKLGFVYRDRVDPFDGGPHLEAKTDDISIVRDTRHVTLDGSCPVRDAKRTGLISYEGEGGAGAENEFRAVMTMYAPSRGEAGLKLPASVIKLLNVKDGARLGLTPMGEPHKPEMVDKRPAKKRTTKKKSRKASS